MNVPVMAAVAVRKKVVSIGHFSQKKEKKNRTEQNELDELIYS